MHKPDLEMCTYGIVVAKMHTGEWIKKEYPHGTLQFRRKNPAK